MTDKPEKRGRGRPKGRLTEAEYKQKQRAKKKLEGVDQICLYMSTDFIKKIDLIVSSYPRLSNRANVFSWLMGQTVEAIYNRTKYFYDIAGIDPDNMNEAEKEVVNLVMDGEHQTAEAGLDYYLSKFQSDLIDTNLDDPALAAQTEELLRSITPQSTAEEVKAHMSRVFPTGSNNKEQSQ